MHVKADSGEGSREGDLLWGSVRATVVGRWMGEAEPDKTSNSDSLERRNLRNVN